MEGGSEDVDSEDDEEGEQQRQKLHPDAEAGDAAHLRSQPVSQWNGDDGSHKRLDDHRAEQAQGDAADFGSKDTTHSNLATALANEVTVHRHQAKDGYQQSHPSEDHQHTQESLVFLVPLLMTLTERVNVFSLMTCNRTYLLLNSILYLLAITMILDECLSGPSIRSTHIVIRIIAEFICTYK